MYDKLQFVLNQHVKLTADDWMLVKDRFHPLAFKKKEKLLDIDKVANQQLKGQRVDLAPIGDQFQSSLEGMGICVDQLCKDAVFLTGDENWKIRWIKGFGTSDQKPKKMKGTVGLALSLNLQ